ncbi:hypothetical protein G5714_019115 [Onychostoma macrolepis]|uniref:Chemokine interleukin-8-like domain-containing protein n=1 Tax=Onychostoma macrolepis TaxID=369639 RepID=A0A7J6C0X7_9TELE|nr:hypothetical protein G5714_019115 [Onychostoma macrolepis]
MLVLYQYSPKTIFFISPTVVAHVAQVPKSCCFKLIDFQIPSSKIKSALKTSAHCPLAGIVVMTPRTEFCVRPDEAWIKQLMENRRWK